MDKINPPKDPAHHSIKVGISAFSLVTWLMKTADRNFARTNLKKGSEIRETRMSVQWLKMLQSQFKRTTFYPHNLHMYINKIGTIGKNTSSS